MNYDRTQPSPNLTPAFGGVAFKEVLVSHRAAETLPVKVRSDMSRDKTRGASSTLCLSAVFFLAVTVGSTYGAAQCGGIPVVHGDTYCCGNIVIVYTCGGTGTHCIIEEEKCDGGCSFLDAEYDVEKCPAATKAHTIALNETILSGPKSGQRSRAACGAGNSEALYAWLREHGRIPSQMTVPNREIAREGSR